MSRKQQAGEGTWYGDPSHFKRVNRREFLHVGFLGGLGLTLGDALRMEASAAMKTGSIIQPKAMSVIQVFLPGGMSAQETLDPKPYAPLEYRGPYGSIKTALPGIRFGEKMPHMAAAADKMAIIRSMTHGEAAHDRGVQNMFTGYRPSPAVSYPSMGSVISHELGERNDLPPYVCIPRQPNTHAGSGYLSTAFGPFGLGNDPAKDNFSVRDLALPAGISHEQFDHRKGLLSVVDNHFRSLESSDALDAMDTFYQQAYRLISSEKAREAFDLKQEPAAMKEKYGKTEPGMRMLMARRLVESGVRFVSLTAGGWDHHENITDGIEKNVPSLDKAFAALLDDLDERGMLDTTLVLLSTEFGRTPKLNDRAGRDHYPKVFSVAMAGGGIQRGLVHGKSDATSTAPDEDPVGVADYAKTIYHLMGIDGEKEIMAPGDRPIEIVDGGRVIHNLLA